VAKRLQSIAIRVSEGKGQDELLLLKSSRVCSFERRGLGERRMIVYSAKAATCRFNFFFNFFFNISPTPIQQSL